MKRAYLSIFVLVLSHSFALAQGPGDLEFPPSRSNPSNVEPSKKLSDAPFERFGLDSSALNTRDAKISECIKATQNQIMALSGEAYRSFNEPGICACPDDQSRPSENDQMERCGDNSAYIQDNGATPWCEKRDVPEEFVRQLCKDAIRNR